MTWIRNLVVAALVVIVATTAFGYGVGVGYYRWPPFGMLLNIARTMSEQASRPGNSSYYEGSASTKFASFSMSSIVTPPGNSRSNSLGFLPQRPSASPLDPTMV